MLLPYAKKVRVCLDVLSSVFISLPVCPVSSQSLKKKTCRLSSIVHTKLAKGVNVNVNGCSKPRFVVKSTENHE